LRVLGRNYPEHLSGSPAEEFAAYMRQVHAEEPALALVDYKGGRRHTPSDALARIATLTADVSLTIEQRAILDGLRDYLGEQFGFVVVTEATGPCEG
jgi:hypothetical protein